MYISRLYVKNYRNFSEFDEYLEKGATTIIGENNSGKSNLLYALRLALDINLSSKYRSLREHDINNSVDYSEPSEVMVSVELSDYQENDYEDALAGTWECEKENIARVTFRFRPKYSIRELIEEEELDRDLNISDYGWELVCGGDRDPSEVDWDEDYGMSLKFSDLQQFKIVFLPALRDSKNDFRTGRISPLDMILTQKVFDENEKEKLVKILKDANEKISKEPTISEIGKEINKEFNKTVGKTYGMDIKLGMAEPSFRSITSSINILLSNEFISDFEISRNSLGINNLIFISMLIDYFKYHVDGRTTVGHLLIIEEPEAHLHPQLQRILYDSLVDSSSQSILTTHSTHISSKSPVRSIITLTYRERLSIGGKRLVQNSSLSPSECDDLERYLDATKSTLLMSRKVLLVEGPAELFLVPALVKSTMDIDLDREGIAVVPIYGKHFHVYAKLFCINGLHKKCAILTDGDLEPRFDDNEDEQEEVEDLLDFENDYLKVFACKTTFERAITTSATVKMFEKTLRKFKKRKCLKSIQSFEKATTKLDKRRRMGIVRDNILNAAKAVGKARFAQEVSKYTNLATKAPSYLEEAVNWLIENEANK